MSTNPLSARSDLQNRQCQRLGARDDRVDAAPFIVAMGVAADGTGATQGRGAERGSEAAVGGAARRLAGYLEAETGRRAAVEIEQFAALFILLQRQETAFAQDAALAAWQFAAAADLAHLTQDFLHDVEGGETHIDGGGGARGDGVDGGAALNEPNIDRRSEVIIGQPVQALDLAS